MRVSVLVGMVLVFISGSALAESRSPVLEVDDSAACVDEKALEHELQALLPVERDYSQMRVHVTARTQGEDIIVRMVAKDGANVVVERDVTVAPDECPDVARMIARVAAPSLEPRGRQSAWGDDDDDGKEVRPKHRRVQPAPHEPERDGCNDLFCWAPPDELHDLIAKDKVLLWVVMAIIPFGPLLATFLIDDDAEVHLRGRVLESALLWSLLPFIPLIFLPVVMVACVFASATGILAVPAALAYVAYVGFMLVFVFVGRLWLAPATMLHVFDDDVKERDGRPSTRARRMHADGARD